MSKTYENKHNGQNSAVHFYNTDADLAFLYIDSRLSTIVYFWIYSVSSCTININTLATFLTSS